MKQTQVPSRRAQHYTFGVEIECFLPEAIVREHGIEIVDYHESSDEYGALPIIHFPPFEGHPWRAEYDASLHPKEGHAAIEVISPVLRGREGIEAILKTCKTLNGWGAKIYGNAAIHVHVGVESVVGPNPNKQAEWLAKLLHLVAQNELVLYAVSGTAERITSDYWQQKIQRISSQYRWGTTETQEVARKVRKASPTKKEETLCKQYEDYRYPDRLCSINITNVFNSHKRTVEFRTFSGSTKGQKIAAWVQLCLALCERAWEAKKYVSWKTPQLRHVDLRNPSNLLLRLFYALGWTKGKKNVRESELVVLGLLTDLDDLRRYKKILRRLVKRFVKEL